MRRSLLLDVFGDVDLVEGGVEHALDALRCAVYFLVYGANILEHSLDERGIVDRTSPHRTGHVSLAAAVVTQTVGGRCLGDAVLPECVVAFGRCLLFVASKQLGSPSTTAIIAVVSNHGLSCEELYFRWTFAHTNEDSEVEVDAQGEERLDCDSLLGCSGSDRV